eukprot:2725525-Prymnesium_polylepis.1
MSYSACLHACGVGYMSGRQGVLGRKQMPSRCHTLTHSRACVWSVPRIARAREPPPVTPRQVLRENVATCHV